MPDNLYWIWHQLLFGTATRRSHEISENFPDPEELYRSRDGVLSEKELIRSRAAMERAELVCESTLKKGCLIITPDYPDYPDPLRDIYARPAALYVRGDLGCLNNRLAIAVVGTRKSSEYGRTVADYLVARLARRDIAIISGLALGIDSASHEAAVREGGKTIGVLGCGLDVDYPQGNRGLKRAIVAGGGAVISEYPMGTEPKPVHFPQRNRIIAGMSRGVLVAEAGTKSGALITANLALDMGRDVFAVPGNIFSNSHSGANQLLKRGMAKPVDSVEDILEEYPELIKNEKFAHIKVEAGSNRSSKPTKSKTVAVAPEELRPVKDTPRREVPEALAEIYSALGNIPRTAGEIAQLTEREIGGVMSELIELEITGYAGSLPGGYFILI